MKLRHEQHCNATSIEFKFNWKKKFNNWNKIELN
jgi:hypothetical protein